MKTLHEEAKYARSMEPEVEELLQKKVDHLFTGENYSDKLYILENNDAVMQIENHLQLVGKLDVASVMTVPKLPDLKVEKKATLNVS